MKKPWFSAKCLFRFPETDSRRQMYEERIILIKAENPDAAVKKAEKNARKYCKGLIVCKFVGLVDVFELFDNKVGETTEVYSSMETNELDPDDYLKKFYPDVPDDCEVEGQEHRWYKKDK